MQQEQKGFLQKKKVPLSGLYVTVENADNLLSLLEGNGPKQSTDCAVASRLMPVSLSFKGSLTAAFSSEVLICISPMRCENGDKARIPLVLLSAARPVSVNGKMFVLLLACLLDRDLKGARQRSRCG